MIGKHRPEAAGRLRLGSGDNLLSQPVNISAVARQLASVGLLVHERRKLVYRRFGEAVVAGVEKIAER